jgi:hypothetical protein
MKDQESKTGRERASADRLSRRFSRDGVVERLPGALAWILQAAVVIASLLREIFDESAYCRFLERNRIPSSPTAYAAFREENDRLKARRPRCC